MHRLGFMPEEIPALIRRLKSQTALLPRSVFSHFVGSDSPQFDDFTRQQNEIFAKASAELQAAFPHKSCATSAIRQGLNVSRVLITTWYASAWDSMASIR